MFSTLKDILGHNTAHSAPQDLKITKLFIHPIKSCRGTSVSEARYDPEGVEHDRKLVIVDGKSHVAITARDLSKMVLITPRIHLDPTSPHGGTIEVSFPADSDSEPFTIPLNPSDELLESWQIVSDAVVWESTNDGYVVQSTDPDAAYGTDTPSETLSHFLGRSVLLIRKGPRKRFVLPTVLFPELKANAAFQDGYPILIATEASVEDIGKRVKNAALVDDVDAEKADTWKIFGLNKDVWKDKEFAIERFRPNVVFNAESLIPYDEERWEELAIGDNGGRLLLVSRCFRCSIPGIDPVTGDEDKSVPAQILNKYRRSDLENPSSSCFGINACPLDSGIYRVGDTVRVTRWVKGGGLLPIPPANSG